MMDIRIRKPEVADVNKLSSLMEQLGYVIDPQDMGKNIRHYSSSHQSAWVAEVEGEVVGCVAASITHYFHKEGKFLRIITMIVDQSYRRRGVGRHLMKVVEEYAREMECSHVELTSGAYRASLGSHDFYLSCGYIELSKDKKYFGKKLVDVPSTYLSNS